REALRRPETERTDPRAQVQDAKRLDVDHLLGEIDQRRRPLVEFTAREHAGRRVQAQPRQARIFDGVALVGPLDGEGLVEADATLRGEEVVAPVALEGLDVAKESLHRGGQALAAL